jgi:signal transduction histidine kinase
MDLLDYVKGQNEPIQVVISPGTTNYIFYKDSVIIARLKLFPYFQLTITGVFLIVAYLLFSTARRSEQNRVWVGMSKETAHQLGTPISSLAGWVEYLKTKEIDSDIISEIQKDIDRLEVVSKRFSKIGSTPQLKEENIYSVLNEVVVYMRPRIPSGIKLLLPEIDPGSVAPIGKELFEWVIENLIRNSVDAIENGKGLIEVKVEDLEKQVIIEITDTGKGIPKNKFKTIFKPGFTTKKRGWGLGLSLVKRIIEDYHKGKVLVRKSEPGIETVFRIVLKK